MFMYANGLSCEKIVTIPIRSLLTRKVQMQRHIISVVHRITLWSTMTV